MNNPITIRPYRGDEIDPLYDAVVESHSELARWMPWCHSAYCRGDSKGWVESRGAAWEARHEFCFIIEGPGERFLGCCGLNRIDWENFTANLGYWVRTSATGGGVATRATELLRDWAFTHTDLHRLEIQASVENLGSQRVAERSGAVREGILRERLLLNGRRHDTVLYSILRSESQNSA